MAVKRAENIIIVDLNAEIDSGWKDGTLTLNVNVPVIGSGLIITGANTGTAQLMYRSETTAVTTAKAGLTMIVEKIV